MIINRIKLLFLFVITLLLGVFIGRLTASDFSNFSARVISDSLRPETSVIVLNKLVGDSIEAEIMGKARILWAEDQLVENDGVHTIHLGKIPNESDLKLRDFPYIGNSKTMKFYPSDSYPARGTHPKFRRYFLSKEAAISEKFIPMKNMK